MRQAVEDGAVAPLLYEGRMAELEVAQDAIDAWFERVTEGLTDEQKLDLKRKFSQTEAISQADQRVQIIHMPEARSLAEAILMGPEGEQMSLFGQADVLLPQAGAVRSYLLGLGCLRSEAAACVMPALISVR